MGNIFWWIIVGAIAGVLAKLLMPGDKGEPKGCILTILLGIAGSVIVGLIMDTFFGGGGGGFVGSIIGATIGAIVLIAIFKKFWAN
jgi:uncharacterized membrane protein YeaQ/YmgE (transglycosylase-associated protein family)